METQSSYEETRGLPARSRSTQASLKIKSMEIAALLTKRGEISGDELELIERRYRLALAMTNLEELFAQGLLDCM
jgi:hypothetical protein